MKKVFNKIKKLFALYKYEVSVISLSIVVLIIGSFTIEFINAFLIIVIFDCLAILIPILMKMYNRKKSIRKSLINERKEEILIKNNVDNLYNDDIKEVKGCGILNKIKRKLKRKNKSKLRFVLKTLLLLFILFMIIGIIVVSIFIYGIVKEAPKLEKDDFYSQEATLILDRNGNEIAKIGSEMREKVSYDELPEILIDAIIEAVSIEDKTTILPAYLFFCNIIDGSLIYFFI